MTGARLHGHAIEARLYAEDVAGRLPAGRRARCTGSGSPTCAGRPDRRRGRRRQRGRRALRLDAGQGHRARRRPATRPAGGWPARWPRPGCTGSSPTGTCWSAMLREEEFAAGHIDTGYLARHDPAELSAGPAPPPRASCTWRPPRWPARPPAGPAPGAARPAVRLAQRAAARTSRGLRVRRGAATRSGTGWTGTALAVVGGRPRRCPVPCSARGQPDLVELDGGRGPRRIGLHRPRRRRHGLRRQPARLDRAGRGGRGSPRPAALAAARLAARADAGHGGPGRGRARATRSGGRAGRHPGGDEDGARRGGAPPAWSATSRCSPARRWTPVPSWPGSPWQRASGQPAGGRDAIRTGRGALDDRCRRYEVQARWPG